MVRGARNRQEEDKDQTLFGLENMKPRPKQKIKFAVCITDSEPDLEMRKIYQIVPDAAAEKEGHLRIVDESGEDYLYPAEFFVPVEVPREAEQALLIAS